MPENPFRDQAEPNRSPYAAPRHLDPPQAVPTEGDATGGVIPYKNPHALIAYYLGLFSLFPCLGFFLAVPALVLGIIGWRRRKQNPAIKGAVHAWIGIVMGAIFTLVWGSTIVTIIVAWFTGLRSTG